MYYLIVCVCALFCAVRSNQKCGECEAVEEFISEPKEQHAAKKHWRRRRRPCSQLNGKIHVLPIELYPTAHTYIRSQNLHQFGIQLSNNIQFWIASTQSTHTHTHGEES